MRSILLALALAGCATTSQSLSRQSLSTTPNAPAHRTLWIDNSTADALVVRVNGVRTATILANHGTCIALRDPGQTLTVRAVGSMRTVSAPTFNQGHAQGWQWRIVSTAGAPGAALDLHPIEPCRTR